MAENAGSKASRIIRREMERIPGRLKIIKGAVAMIVCPFHADRSPSCMVNIEATDRFPVGFFYCLGCPEKGEWNKLAEKMGLAKIKESDSKTDNAIDYRLGDIRDALLPRSGVKLVDILHSMKVGLIVEPRKKWRRIKPETLLAVGAKECYDSVESDSALIFPVHINEQVVGAVKARLKKQKGKLSYVTSPGQWVKSHGLFLYDEAIEMALRKKMSVCIVEGPRDALYLMQKGIPAMAILGSKNWSSVKRDLLIEAEVAGYILVLDSDDAGETARKLLFKDLKKQVWTRQFNLRKLCKENDWEKVDPATLPREYIRLLRTAAKKKAPSD